MVKFLWCRKKRPIAQRFSIVALNAQELEVSRTVLLQVKRKPPIRGESVVFVALRNDAIKL